MKPAAEVRPILAELFTPEEARTIGRALEMLEATMKISDRISPDMANKHTQVLALRLAPVFFQAANTEK